MSRAGPKLADQVRSEVEQAPEPPLTGFERRAYVRALARLVFGAQAEAERLQKLRKVGP